MKRFKKYLAEARKKDTGFKLYVDMDGVLADFETAAKKAVGVDRIDRIDQQELWDAVERRGPKFWENLKKLGDADELWRFVKPYNPTILTSPSKSEWCIPGKKKWAKKHFGNVKVICEKKKAKYARPNTILIDDWNKQTKRFEAAGGIGIIHKSAKATIEELKRYGFE